MVESLIGVLLVNQQELEQQQQPHLLHGLVRLILFYLLVPVFLPEALMQLVSYFQAEVLVVDRAQTLRVKDLQTQLKVFRHLFLREPL